MKNSKVPSWVIQDEDGYTINLVEIQNCEPERFKKTYAKRLETFCHEVSQELNSKVTQINECTQLDDDKICDLVYECLVYSVPNVPWTSPETIKEAHAFLGKLLETPAFKATGITTEEGLILSALKNLMKKVFKPKIQGPAEKIDPTLLHAIVHCFTAYVKYPNLSQHAEFVINFSKFLLDNKECVYDLRVMGATLLNHSALDLNAAEYRWYKEIVKHEITTTLWSHEVGLLKIMIPCAVNTCRIMSDDKDFIESVLELWIKCITLATENKIKSGFVQYLTQLLGVCPLDMVILNLKSLVPLIAELILMSDTDTRLAAAQATLWMINMCWVRIRPYCMVIARHCTLSYVDWADVEGNDALIDTIKQILSKLLLLCKEEESIREDLEAVIKVAEINL